jgi:hypothetical protein
MKSQPKIGRRAETKEHVDRSRDPNGAFLNPPSHKGVRVRRVLCGPGRDCRVQMRAATNPDRVYLEVG